MFFSLKQSICVALAVLVGNGVFSSCARNPGNIPSVEPSSAKVASQIDVASVSPSARQQVTGPDDTEVGVFFMPSWNTSSDPNVDVDSFWACLQGRENCAFLNDPSIWGTQGRIYNRQNPYEGPFLGKKPHESLKGFYKRDDPQVARQQITYMKEYGIDFFVYKWFFGRHYYYHLDYAPQSSIFYPKGWPKDRSKSGRVAVPGVEQWDTQLKVLLAENKKLSANQRIKFALSWTDDSDERWVDWLKMGSPETIASRANFPGEKPTKTAYLQVHDKMTLLWIQQYFLRDDYLKDELGRPVLYLYFPHDTEARAAYYGLSLSELLERSSALARKSGLPGIKFIAVTSGVMLEAERNYGMPTTWKATDESRPWLGGSYGKRMLMQEYVPRLKDMGFDGMTGYVYHTFRGLSNKSYADMRQTYREHWREWSTLFRPDPSFEYQVPVAMGWDRRPAGGTWPQSSGFPSEPAKDKVISTKATFTEKLAEAKAVSERNRPSNGNTVMICCWNEYLEGNHIEPTQGHGFDYLEAIKEVFEK
nr:hypothetical protein [Cytophagales bacterium]